MVTYGAFANANASLQEITCVGQYKLKGADCEEELFRCELRILSTLILSGLAGLFPPEIKNPQATGPFPVGVTTTVFIDNTRTDALTKGPRTLVTEIWYPTTDDARTLAKASFTDLCRAVLLRAGIHAESAYKSLERGSQSQLLDARCPRCEGPRGAVPRRALFTWESGIEVSEHFLV